MICSICLRFLWISTKLVCGHRFHKKCIQQWRLKKPACPLCSHPIFNHDEKYLIDMSLKNKVTQRMIHLLSRMEVTHLFLYALHHHIYQLITLIITWSDCTFIFVKMMDNSVMINYLLDQSIKINWFRTFEGKLILELAEENPYLDRETKDRIQHVFYHHPSP